MELAHATLKNKRKNAKWATLNVDETAEALGVPKQLVRPGPIRARTAGREGHRGMSYTHLRHDMPG